MTSSLWATAGFLGIKTDWDVFDFQNLKSFDLNEFKWENFADWSQQFNLLAASQETKPILMGYSLGGRMALHALIAKPELWKAGIIISAHPGLLTTEERLVRFENDSKWGERFLKEEWSSLIHDWNNQAIFKNDLFKFNRYENNYKRENLHHVLTHTSLGLQDDLREQITKLPLPILWITGERDKKCCQIADSIQLSHPYSKKIIVSETGHRTAWEQPSLFKKIINDFLLI